MVLSVTAPMERVQSPELRKILSGGSESDRALTHSSQQALPLVQYGQARRTARPFLL